MFTENCRLLIITSSRSSPWRVNVTVPYEGGVAEYQCVSNNYHLEGPSRRECLGDGTWSGSEPSCISELPKHKRERHSHK